MHPDVEALYVPLPTGLRNAWIDKAIAAGKHVYSEKPMGGSVQDLKKILDACEQKGVQWMDGTMWHPRMPALPQATATGRLSRAPLR